MTRASPCMTNDKESVRHSSLSAQREVIRHSKNMAEKLTAVKGMNDIVPPHSATWEWLEQQVRSLMVRYAYRNIRTPILEPTALFVRGLGEVTDIVEKE